MTNIELDFNFGNTQTNPPPENDREKLTYTLNPSMNKRIKSKKIEDLRKVAVNNMKKSLTMMNSAGGM